MLPDKLDLYFDGSCGPDNPGGIAGYAWRILGPDKKVVAEDAGEVCRGPTATNNIGEWGAVQKGLEFLKGQGWKGELNIRGDSQLVIYQLLGKYKCRKDTLIPYYDSCKILLGDMKWDAHWIPREQNDECDKMSKYAYSDGSRKSYRRSKRSGSKDHGGSEVAGQGREGSHTISSRPCLGEETEEVAFD